MLDLAARPFHIALDACDLSAGIRTDFLRVGSSFFHFLVGRDDFAAGRF